MLWSSSTGLAVTDRGLQFGDGLFETLLVFPTSSLDAKPKAWLLDAHLARLRQGCERLGILYPADLIEQQVATALTHLVQGFGVLKIVVTAQGPQQGATRGYARDHEANAHLHCSLHRASATPFDALEPVRVRVTNTQLATQPALAGIKHLNRLEQVLARRELQQGDFEGLMLNPEQGVVECTSANLFVVLDGQLCTPPLTHCGVAGVLRQHLLANLGDAVHQRPLELQDLRQAQELFLGNSVYGLRSVGELVGPRWSQRYSSDQWFQRCQALLQDELRRESGNAALGTLDA